MNVIAVFKYFSVFMDKKSVRKMDKSTVLKKMSDMLMLQYNMEYLEWIFDRYGEDNLLDRCIKFSSMNKFMLKEFQAAVTPGKFYSMFVRFEIIFIQSSYRMVP